MRRAAALLVVVLAAALAGCVAPDVDKSAIVDYLNAGTTSRAIGCPFPVDDDAHEGIVAADGAHDLAATADGRILLAEDRRIRVVSTNFTTVANWSLPLTTGDVHVDAGADLVAAIQRIDASTSRVTTFEPDGSPIASRNLTVPWRPGVHVDDGRVWTAADRSADGADLAVHAPNLTLQRRVDLQHPASRVHAFGTCQRRLLWLSGGGAPGASALRVDGPDLPNATALATFDDARHLAVGQDLAFVTAANDRHQLRVFVANGTELLELSNRDGQPYGRFDIAHDLVYNLRGDAVLVRPLADFLTRPS